MNLINHCKDCVDRCYSYHPKTGEVIYKKCFIAKIVRVKYKELLTEGVTIPNSILTKLRETKPPAAFYLPNISWKRVAVNFLYLNIKMEFRVIPLHYLIDVFLSTIEDEKSIYNMWGENFILVTGLVNTPNRRLMDILDEFLTAYRYTKLFAVFMVKEDRAIKSILAKHDLPVITLIQSGKQGDLF